MGGLNTRGGKSAYSGQPDVFVTLAISVAVIGRVRSASKYPFSKAAAMMKGGAKQSGTTVVPNLSQDPGCYRQSTPGPQIVYKASIGNNANGNGAQAFLFERQKSSDSDPAVIQIN